MPDRWRWSSNVLDVYMLSLTQTDLVVEFQTGLLHHYINISPSFSFYTAILVWTRTWRFNQNLFFFRFLIIFFFIFHYLFILSSACNFFFLFLCVFLPTFLYFLIFSTLYSIFLPLLPPILYYSPPGFLITFYPLLFPCFFVRRWKCRRPAARLLSLWSIYKVRMHSHSSARFLCIHLYILLTSFLSQ
jgi:hypothetical protein